MNGRAQAACAAQALVWLLAAAWMPFVAGAVPAAGVLSALALLAFAGRSLQGLAQRYSGDGRGARELSVARVVMEARARPCVQWLGRGGEWTARRAARAAAPGQVPGAVAADTGLGRSGGALRVPLSALSSHLLVFGQTGSGKTRFASLYATSFIARHPEGALILFDPKGDADLRAVVRAACAEAGRPHAFIELDLSRPGQSVRFDPLRNYARTTSVASRVASLLPEAHSGSPFAAFAWRQLLVLADALHYVGDRPTLAALRAVVEGDGQALLDRTLEAWSRRTPAPPGAAAEGAGARALARYRAVVAACPVRADPVVDALVEVVTHDRVHRGKMIQSLLPVLAALTARDLRALLSPDAGEDDARPVFDSHKVIDQSRVLYVGLDVLTDPMVGSALGSLVLADLAQVAGQRVRQGGSPVLVMIDEAAELAGEPLLQLLNKSRGAGFQLVLAAQTVHDFAARLGSTAMASALLGNPGNVIALRTSDAGTQRFFTDALPPIHCAERGEGRSMAKVGSGPRSHPSATASWQVRVTPAPWVAPGALSQLPDLHFFARTADGRVWRGALPFLSARP